MLVRRSFLENLINTVIGPGDKTDQRVFDNVDTSDFFSSFEKCYALFAEIPMEDLISAAEGMGFKTEGMSKLEIARAIFENPADSEHEKNESPPRQGTIPSS